MRNLQKMRRLASESPLPNLKTQLRLRLPRGREVIYVTQQYSNSTVERIELW